MWLWEREALEKRVIEKHGKTLDELFSELTGIPLYAVEAGREASRARAKWNRWMDTEIEKLDE